MSTSMTNATYTQLPGTLDVFAAHTDGLSITGSLGFSTVNDTLTAVIYEDTPAGYAAAIAATPAPAATWSITRVDNSIGAITLSLAASTVKGLSLAKSYRWFLRSSALDRAAISGTFTLRAP
jgi:hypothetical protein